MGHLSQFTSQCFPAAPVKEKGAYPRPRTARPPDHTGGGNGTAEDGISAAGSNLKTTPCGPGVPPSRRYCTVWCAATSGCWGNREAGMRVSYALFALRERPRWPGLGWASASGWGRKGRRGGSAWWCCGMRASDIRLLARSRTSRFLLDLGSSWPGIQAPLVFCTPRRNDNSLFRGPRRCASFITPPGALMRRTQLPILAESTSAFPRRHPVTHADVAPRWPA